MLKEGSDCVEAIVSHPVVGVAHFGSNVSERLRSSRGSSGDIDKLTSTLRSNDCMTSA